MHSEQRRQAILDILQQAQLPVSAGTLAGRLSVSRQIIVGDVALLRAAGAEISATPRSYILQSSSSGIVRTVACRHTAADMEAELNIMVDHGCTVLDVIVDHPIYGQLTGPLHLHSRYDVQQFIVRSHEAAAAPLSLLTEGIHLHTLSCPDEAAYLRVQAALEHADFLLRP